MNNGALIKDPRQTAVYLRQVALSSTIRAKYTNKN